MLAVRRVLEASAGIGPDHPKRLCCHFIWFLTFDLRCEMPCSRMRLQGYQWEGPATNGVRPPA